MASLYNNIDGKEAYARGHNIVKAPKSFVRNVPQELKSNESVKKLLARVFPKMASDKHQRTQAGRWARVIQLHYRHYHSERLTAEEMRLTFYQVHSIKTHILNALQNKRLDGSGSYKRKKNGN